MRKHAFTCPDWRALSACLAVLCLGLAPGHLRAADEPDTRREIHVPFDAIPVLFEEESDRVLMPRAQFEELRAKAAIRAVQNAPVAILPVAAQYRIAASQDRAVISAELRISVLAEGLHALSLPFSGLGLRRAQVAGRAAAVGRSDDGRLLLFMEGRGDHTLTVEAVAPLQTTAARQVLDIAVPMPPGTRVVLTVPGDVEVKSGAAVAARAWDEKTGETRFDLVPSAERLAVVMTLNSRLKRKDRVVVARSVLIDEVTEAYERLHATVSVDILHRAVDDLRFVLPAGFEITAVESPLLSRWAVSHDARGPLLEVFLREEVTGSVVLGLSALRVRPDLKAWRFPTLEPQDVAGQVAVIGVLLERRLKIEELNTTGVIPIGHDVLLQALPASARLDDPGRPPLRAAMAGYAPSTEAAVSGRFDRPAAARRVTTNLLLTVRKSGLTVRGGLALLAENETLFSIDVDVPPGWDVTRVTDAAGAALPFERYGTSVGHGRLHVRFPRGFAPGVPQTVIFEAAQIPPGWLDAWTEQHVGFPVFAVRDVTHDTGALAANALDDLRLRPDALQGLMPLNENEKAKYGLAGVETALAFRYDASPFAASLTVSQVQPRATAETFSFFRVEQDALICHGEVAYDVEEARASRLELLLPASTPIALSIRGLGDTMVKEFAGEEAGEWRRWRVELAQPAGGTCRLAVDFQMRLDGGERQELSLPILRAEGVAYQSGFLALEGNPEMDIQVRHTCRKVDIGELVEAEYQPGARLLGAYGFVGDPPPVTLTVVRPHGCALPVAIVQNAQIVTTLSAEGRAQSEATYTLHAKALYLEIGLPDDSELWSVTVDGIPASPQEEHERILLDLPAGPTTLVRVVRLVYETRLPTLCGLGALGLRAPRLAFHGMGGDPAGVSVPVADLSWRVYLPSGYDVLHTTGTVAAADLARPGLAAVNLLRGVYVAGGRIRFGHGLLGGCFLALQSAREKARYSEGKFALPQESLVERADGEGALPAPAAAALPATQTPPAATGLAVAGKEARDLATAETRPAAGRPPPAPTQATAPGWAVEGARSLTIGLAARGASVSFNGLGEQPAVRLLLASRRRLSALAWAVGAAVLVAGAGLTRRDGRTKALYLAAVLGAATVLPVLPGGLALTAVFNAAFYAGAVLIPYYLLARIGGRALRSTRRLHGVPATAGALPFLGLAAVALSVAAPLRAAERLPPLGVQPVVIQGTPLLEPVVVPKDAVIVPYDPGRENPAGERVLVPRETFATLWQAAYPDPTRSAPPAPFALAGMSLAAALGNADGLVLAGTLEIESFSDDLTEMPLPFEGAVLTQAVLDGQPARLRVVQAEVPVQAEAQSSPSEAPTLLALPIQGRGRHRLDISLQFKLSREGGWRVVRGRLPAVPVAALDLTVPDAGTEVRVNDVPDRSVYEATTASQVIRTTLPLTGALHLRWRPRVGEGQADPSLTVASRATLDVLEDRLQTAWAMELSFRHGDRDLFTVDLPADYRVERVEGTNVRGWEVRQESAAQRLEVSLLKQARGSETFTVHAWRQMTGGLDAETAVEVPVLTVSGAMRHAGQLLVRHSPALVLRVGEQSGVRRTDIQAETALTQRESPLGVRPFQAYAFVQVPFVLRLAATAARPEVSARVQTILRIAERERDVESRILLSVSQRPLHRVRVEVPADLEVERVSAPGEFEWAVGKGPVAQTVTVYLANGVQGDVAIVIGGRVGVVDVVERVSLPRLWVLDVGRQEGDIAVQADPMYDVLPRDLSNLEAALLRRVTAWLSEAQRPLTRLAFHYAVRDYAGQLVVQPRKADVRCHTITNVRITDRAIEETTLLCFTVYNAGTQEFRFRVPKRLADARVSVPHLRQKTVLPVADSEDVTVLLELQDQVMNDVRVLVEHDRLLNDREQEVILPVVETGRTDRQYLAVESAGRDEVQTHPGEAFEVLTAQQKEWAAVSALFQGGSTQAFIAVPGAGVPRLTFRTNPRVAVETAGARIGLAETLLILDDSGAYRASQTYHVDNRTEQFLDLELPVGAALWTVRVAGELAKPILPATADPCRVRVPLVKTAAGDLDYAVVLKYAGRLTIPGPVLPADLPFVRTLNLNVEQSHVELWLPTTRRWFAFGGTLRHVRQGGEFEAGYLAYQNRLAKRLLETLQYGSVFEKARAVSNLRQINVKMVESQQALGENMFANTDLQVQYATSQKLVQDADRTLRRAEAEQAAETLVDNRARMNVAYGSQSTGLARNRVIQAGANWDFEEVRKGDVVSAVSSFDTAWLARNELREAREGTTSDGKDTGPGGREDKRQMSSVAKGAAIVGQVTTHAQPTEAPQAVQISVDAAESQVAQAPAKSALARRGLQSRAAQYQEKLEAKGKAEAAAGSAPMLPGLVAGSAGGMPGMPGPGAAPGMPAAGGQLQSGMAMSGTAPPSEVFGRPLFAYAGPAGDGGLASLDVSFPSFDPRRWSAQRFTTPRGAVRIRARALSSHVTDSVERLLVALAAIGLVLGVTRLWRRRSLSLDAQRSLANTAMLGGTLSLLAGVFPLYGVLALLVGVVWRAALALVRALARS